MYRIMVLTGGEEYPLWIPQDEELIVFSPILTVDMSTAWNLTFEITALHPYTDKLLPYASEIYVYDEEEEIFCGRMIEPAKDFNNTLSVSCEGELSYLLDSIQEPYEHTGSIRDFLKKLLNNHNSQVEERKQFLLGNVSVVDTNNYINRSSSDYSNTLDTFRAKLIDTHGGYPRVRHQDGKRYLDYVTDYGGINSQTIRFGENMLDMSQYMDGTGIITRLIPIGAKVEIVNPDGTKGTETVTIQSVNGGKNYIEHMAGIREYGYITGIQKWEDVTLPENLLAKARAYLDEAVALPQTLEITAVDLGLIDVDVQKLKLGCWTTVESVPHGISKQFLLSKKEIHLDDPAKDQITLGKTIATFTSGSAKQEVQVSQRVDQVANEASQEINRKVENATQLITGGLGGYIVIGRAEDGHPEELLVMDAPKKEDAKNVIRLNRNGLGFSITGYNGVYRNAWTIDGNLTADFITAGSMLADRIRGGTLEVGGKSLGKDGQITIRDAEGIVIGQLSKDGIQINNGYFNGHIEVGGKQEGSITVKDETGKIIGTWSKAGLSILKGIISGSFIQVGGVNNQDGTILVMDDQGKEVAKIDNAGVRVNYESRFGFEATKNYIKQGEFILQRGKSSGFRTLFESSDEKTGMSAGHLDDGQLYLWAGYNDSDDYAFLVNERDEVHCNDLWLQDWHRIYREYKRNNEMVLELDMDLFKAKSLLYTIIDLYNNHNGDNRNIFILADMIYDLQARVNALENVL